MKKAIKRSMKTETKYVVSKRVYLLSLISGILTYFGGAEFLKWVKILEVSIWLKMLSIFVLIGGFIPIVFVMCFAITEKEAKTWEIVEK